jgi:DNA adenine methylase
MPTFYARQGGKRLLAKQILKMFPNEWGIYVEPFFGAGNLFFSIPKPDCEKCEVINDLDKEIYHVLKDVQKITKEDVQKMDFTPSEKKWIELKELKTTDPIQRLYRFLYLNWWSFGGKMLNFSRERSHSASQRKRGFLSRLDAIQERLKGVIIDDEDYKTILRNYDSSDTFFYLDPPYYEVDTGGYEHGFIHVEELALALKNIKGQFLLSYNDHPYIRKMFSGFTIKTIKSIYTIRGNDQPVERPELLIMNY